MTKKIQAKVSYSLLASGTQYSDRFVYSNYFVPLLVTHDDAATPMLPFYTKQYVLELVKADIIDEDRLQAILQQLGMSQLWEVNNMSEAGERLDEAVVVNGKGQNGGYAGLQRITRDIRETDALLGAFESQPDTGGDELLTVVSRRLSRSVQELLAGSAEVAQEMPVANGDVSTLPIGGKVDFDQVWKKTPRATILAEQDAEFIAGLLQSTVGYFFLDRTRIRPAGFAIGEHVYALGLAPGEEVVIEQKTFTKRQATFEDQSEQEKQFDIELSSTYSTELQEGYERQNSLTGGWGHHADHTGQYSSPAGLAWGQINAQHTLGSTMNATSASEESARRSVKDGQTASSKVSAKYRTQHKTTFSVTTESGFEVSAKRTIRNPNRATPLTLHYFKVMQRLRMHQQRYGVRLCWAPSIESPARTFFDRVRAGRAQIIADAEAALPPRPIEPNPSAPADTEAPTARESKTFSSDVISAYLWDIGGGMRANYDVDIPIEAGYTWDGIQLADSSIIVVTNRASVSRWFVGSAHTVGSNLRARVHLETAPQLFAGGIDFQIQARFYKDVTSSQAVSTDTKYLDDLAAYRVALQAWTDSRDATVAAAQQAAVAFERRLLASLSPISEMISQIVEQYFPPSVRDEVWEIDYWQRLFDWDRASFVSYPSWWSTGAGTQGGETRDPLLDPSDFINASWAKLYLPVRAGMEHLALRWIFGKAVAVPLSDAEEARFAAIVEDLRQYRSDMLGAPDESLELYEPCQPVPEKFACLASWTELMPTDGTHIEVVHAATTAADVATQREIDDAAALRRALIESEKRSVMLKDKAEQQMTEPAAIKVHVGADGAGS